MDNSINGFDYRQNYHNRQAKTYLVAFLLVLPAIAIAFLHPTHPFAEGILWGSLLLSWTVGVLMIWWWRLYQGEPEPITTKDQQKFHDDFNKWLESMGGEMA